MFPAICNNGCDKGSSGAKSPFSSFSLCQILLGMSVAVTETWYIVATKHELDLY